jgi:hypothetical protein
MLPGLHGNSRLHLENPRLSPSQTSIKTGEPEDICLVNDECSLNYSLCTCHRQFCEDLCRSASFNLTLSKFSKSVGWFFSLRYDRNVAAAHLLAFMVLLAFNSVLRTAISSSVREENMAAAILFICFCRLMMTQ